MRTGFAVLVATTAVLASACGDASDPERVTRPTPGSTGTPTTGPAREVPTLTPAVIARDLASPVAVAWRTGDDRTFVAEQDGRVIAVRNEGRTARESVLEFDVASGGEQGLLGLAFSADGATLFTHSTDPDGDTRIDAWTMRGRRADPATRRLLLAVDQPYANHNGGSIVVAADGRLWIGLGDGGGAGDPEGNAQDPTSLLGKIVRLDPAAVRPRPEIVMTGLRNPWRFSFDRTTGAIWIGDVGQSEREEIDTAPAGATGINWGWDRREGDRAFEGPPPPGARGPILAIPHGPACSVIGGYVYRGRAEPALVGRYVFGDYCDPAIRSFAIADDRAVDIREIARIDELTSFGEDPDGELWATSGRGELVRLTGR